MSPLFLDETLPLKMLFLCTGNSARSQMAEGLARHLGKGRISPQSAGLSPTGIHPLAIAVMDEIGIDIRTQASKEIDPKLLEQAAIVITLCGHADTRCPVLPPHVQKVHWPLSDPAAARGSESERHKVFQDTRDEIKVRVLDFLEKKHDFRKEPQVS